MPMLDRHAIVAELCASGYDARLYEHVDECGFDPFVNRDDWGYTGRTEVGVAVHGIYVQGWRYPDGSWTFSERPAVLLDADEHDPRGLCRWYHALSLTFDGPPENAPPHRVVSWIIDRLGPPDDPHCRLYRHIDDAEQCPAAPQQWRQAWQQTIAEPITYLRRPSAR